jgi:hypothetical protein
VLAKKLRRQRGWVAQNLRRQFPGGDRSWKSVFLEARLPLFLINIAVTPGVEVAESAWVFGLRNSLLSARIE